MTRLIQCQVCGWNSSMPHDHETYATTSPRRADWPPHQLSEPLTGGSPWLPEDGRTWTLEFDEHSIGHGIDVLRQHTPPGAMIPDSTEGHYLDRRVVSSDYEFLEAVRTHLVSEGLKAEITPRF